MSTTQYKVCFINGLRNQRRNSNLQSAHNSDIPMLLRVYRGKEMVGWWWWGGGGAWEM